MKIEGQAQPAGGRGVVAGKFFALGGRRFLLKGVTYGPFAPDAAGERFGSPVWVTRDLALIRELGANTLRTYHVPPHWFLDQVEEQELKLLVDIPWPKHLCVLDSAREIRESRETLLRAIGGIGGHPAVLAVSVANEIPAEIVRYTGADRITGFLEDLIDLGRGLDPTCLFTYANYPSTEYVNPRNTDFVMFNLYLHELASYRAYLARLQMIADRKPLVLGEVGMDSLRMGEPAVGDFLAWQIQHGFQKGLAGICVFSFTDEWHRGAREVTDWAFGLTSRSRERKPAFGMVQSLYRAAPLFAVPEWPAVSVVVACYNGAETLRACLDSLETLDYPDYEVIVVDDGSTDDTPAICREYPWARIIRQDNQGLSAARNAGISSARGRIVAFTDADCRVDEQWLRYLVSDLMASGAVGIGGHNLLPPDDSAVAAAVMAAPGGPVHVMLSDEEAEHVPGCNMAFYRRALDEIERFDPVFRKAGDDVDVCWRLQQRGYKLAFSPGGFVWHYRRSTVSAYLRQQMGYGEAEALLARKHPEFFNRIGNGIWRGKIYGTDAWGFTLQRGVIYHGLFGGGLFQRLYAAPPSGLLHLGTTPEYLVLLALPTLVLAIMVPAVWVMALPVLLLPLVVGIAAGYHARLPRSHRHWWSRPLVGLLFLMQPLCRGLARYRTRMALTPAGRPPAVTTDDLPLVSLVESNTVLAYWAPSRVDRVEVLHAIGMAAERHGFRVRRDAGWHRFDLELIGDAWARFRLVTTTEELEGGANNLRCRLEVSWSFAANLLFFSSCFVVGLAIWLWAGREPWIWMFPVLLPLLLWTIEARHLVTASIIAGLVRTVVEPKGMKPLVDTDRGRV